MFGKTLAELLLVPLLIIWIFQPIFHEVSSIRRDALDKTLDLGIQQATSAENGRFTPEIIQDMKDILSTKFFIPEADIEFVGTTVLTPYGEYIEGRLSIKAPPRWIFEYVAGTSNEDAEFATYAKMMSQYVDR